MGLILLFLVITISFVIIQIKKLVPDIELKGLITRAASLLFFGFIISLYIGILLINWTGDKILDRSGILSSYFSERIIFPEENLKVSFVNDETKALVKEILDAYKLNEDRKTEEFKNKICYINLKYRSLYEENKLSLFRYLQYLQFGKSEDKNHRLMYVLKFYYPEMDIYVLPHLLIYKTIFVLFFGIFLQLIFEEKPVTEPL